MKKFLDEKPIYLPALQGPYLNYIGNPRERETKNVKNEDLNFLNSRKLFCHKWALYSVGHVVKEKALNKPLKPMLRNRDRDDTLLFGDSGGYQIGTFVNPNPATAKERDDYYGWLKENTDLAMTIDVPPWMKGSSFNDCAVKTLEHLDHLHNSKFANHKWLTVLQGQTREDALTWMDMMKGFHSYGWAFAGATNVQPFSIIERVLLLVEEGLISEERPWLHFLGHSDLPFYGFLTALQRGLRSQVSPNIQISCDTSSPLLMSAKFVSYYENYSISNMTMPNKRLVLNQMSVNSTKPFPNQSTAVSRKLDVGDLVVNPGKAHPFAWAAVANHNIEVTLDAHREVAKEVATDYSSDPHRDPLPRDLRDTTDLLEELFTIMPDMALEEMWALDVFKNLANTFERNKTNAVFGDLDLSNLENWYKIGDTGNVDLVFSENFHQSVEKLRNGAKWWGA
jgi:hypothetical protein